VHRNKGLAALISAWRFLMILLSVLGLALGTAAQLVSLLASSKFAVANGPDVGAMALPNPRTSIHHNGAAVADPGWTAFMRGM
jgi:hypothetical protein